MRGLGLLQGLELVRDRETLAPVPGAAARLVAACRERGLMIYACATPLGATTIEAVMLAPPLTIADAELDEVVAILRRRARRDGSGSATAITGAARLARRETRAALPGFPRALGACLLARQLAVHDPRRTGCAS